MTFKMEVFNDQIDGCFFAAAQMTAVGSVTGLGLSKPKAIKPSDLLCLLV